MEVPKLEKDLWQVYKDKGLVVLGIDLGESSGVVKSWADTKNLSYPILLNNQSTVWANYGMGYIPHNVVLDSSFIVRYTAYGYDHDKILTTIQTYLPSDVNEDEPTIPDNLDIIASYPNPFKNQTKFVVNVEKDQSYSLKIYDLSGKLVKIVAETIMSNLPEIQLWNRTDDHNNRVTSGVYFAEISTPSRKKSIKLLVID